MRCHTLNLLFLSLLMVESTTFADHRTTTSPLVVDSRDFIVRTFQDGPPAVDVLERCERLHEELQQLWLDTQAEDASRPKCEIVVHATRESYLQVVGRGGGQTSGSSLIRFEKGRVLTRRIDLLVDAQGRLPALPHELTHIILADRFGGRQPPRWLDEGIATLADCAEKRRLHLRDCQFALRSGTALRMIEILNLKQFASAQQVPAFYGQSLSMVHFLTELEKPGRVVDFVEAALDHGYDRALRQYYNIDGVAALEARWRTYAVAHRQ